jgi:DNA-binding CsgD family transcriptional regulator
MRLVERDAAALLRFVGDLHEVDDPLPFPPWLLGRLHALIPSTEISYSELDPARERMVLVVKAHADGTHELTAGGEPTDVDRLWWRLRPSHPVCGYRVRSGDWTTPRKASDFLTLREFRRTAIYDAFYRGDLDHWLDVGLPAAPSLTRVFIFDRFGRDFDERDRAVLTLLRPHLQARYETAVTASEAAAALAAVEEDARDEARLIVLCSGRGVIEFASAAARALLREFLGVADGQLPAGVLGRRRLVVARGERRLTVRAARAGALHVLLLGERDARLDRLTPREREVLGRVALGRGNDQIAQELGVASATVAKHLEHVYEKTGVANRTAAARLLGDQVT